MYTLRLIVRSPIGCIDTSYSYHEALIVPEAGFTTQPEVNLISIFNNDVQFIDQSINAAAWNWNFNDLDQSTLQNPTFSFPDTGWVRVTQIVTHPNGCRDTALFNLDIVPKISYFLPNAFTPNNDGVNDIYMGAGHFEYIQDFSMQIYNRWGEMIYENKNPFDFWNGRKFNTGERCQLGVYVVVVRIKGPRGFEEEIRGFATIVD
jgi:gliding motility-associated-like protein